MECLLPNQELVLVSYSQHTVNILLKIFCVSVLLGLCYPQSDVHAQRLATEFRDIQVLPNLDTLIRYRRGGDFWFGGMVGGIGGLYFGTINVNRLAPDESRGTISISDGDGTGYYTGLLAEYIPVGEKLGVSLKVSLFDKRIGTGVSEVISGITVNSREVDSLHRYSTIATNYYISFSPEIRYNLNNKGLHFMGGLDAEILAGARASTLREFDNIGRITEQRVNPSYAASPFRFGAHVGLGLDIVSATLSSGIRFRFCPYITLNSGTVTTTNLGSSWNTVFARFGVAVKFGIDNVTDTIRKYDSSFVEPPHFLATIQWEKGISVPSYRTAERLAVADLALSAVEAPTVDVTKETIGPSDETKTPTSDVTIADADIKKPITDEKISISVDKPTTPEVKTPVPDIKTPSGSGTIADGQNKQPISEIKPPGGEAKPPVANDPRQNNDTQQQGNTTPQQGNTTPQQSIADISPRADARPNTPIVSTNEGIKTPATEKKAVKIAVGDKKTFYFSTSKSINLSPESKEYYDEVAEYLKKNPRAIVYIVGHTDNQGTDEELQKISDDRALQVRGYFERKGIPRRRLFPSGKSSQEPVKTNTTAAGRAENRRVEITISNGR